MSSLREIGRNKVLHTIVMKRVDFGGKKEGEEEWKRRKEAWRVPLVFGVLKCFGTINKRKEMATLETNDKM